MANHKNTLGIMAVRNVSGFSEMAYYRYLTLAGRKRGLRVFIFSPRDVDYQTRTVFGYEYTKTGWKGASLPLPCFIYDRFFRESHTGHYQTVLHQLQTDPHIQFLGRGLPGKWRVHNILRQSSELVRWLPDTYLYSPQELFALLARQGAAIVKPTTGTHGAGVLRIQAINKAYHVTGRNATNQLIRRTFLTRSSLERYLRYVTAKRRYLLQPYLSLHTPNDTPFDIRILVQKNGEGKWQTTGKAVRLGNSKSITSNLHGGGKAYALSPFLAKYFSPEQCSRMEAEMEVLANILPPFLEAHHGPLVELGLDVGIDRSGMVWIIEVNSRPGRNVFRQLQDEEARRCSMTRPVEYAHYLMKERVGGY